MNELITGYEGIWLHAGKTLTVLVRHKIKIAQYWGILGVRYLRAGSIGFPVCLFLPSQVWRRVGCVSRYFTRIPKKPCLTFPWLLPWKPISTTAATFKTPGKSPGVGVFSGLCWRFKRSSNCSYPLLLVLFFTVLSGASVWVETYSWLFIFFRRFVSLWLGSSLCPFGLFRGCLFVFLLLSSVSGICSSGVTGGWCCILLIFRFFRPDGLNFNIFVLTIGSDWWVPWLVGHFPFRCVPGL